MNWLRGLGAGLVALLMVGCAPPPYINADNAQLKTLQAQGVPVYDVRRPEEWRQTGVVEGSRKLTFVDASGKLNPDFLPQFTAEVGKNEPVVLICRTGSRTDKLARMLMEEHGYTQVYNVRNGITGWMADKHPVVKN